MAEVSQEEYEARRYQLLKPQLASFLNIDEPRKVKRNGKEVGEAKFSLNLELLADSDDLKNIRARIVSQARAMWPSLNVGEAIKSGALIVPLEDGDKIADKQKGKGKPREWSRGRQVLTARTKNAPGVGIITGGQIVQLDGKAEIVARKSAFFFTGVEVLAELDFVAYDAVDDAGKPGVTCYLNSVLSTGKGEKLIKGRDLKETFSGYAGIDSTEDPTGGSAAGDDW